MTLEQIVNEKLDSYEKRITDLVNYNNALLMEKRQLIDEAAGLRNANANLRYEIERLTDAMYNAGSSR